MTEPVQFPCPFCGKTCLVGKIPVQGEPEAVEGVLHVTPVCQTFEESDPLEFMEHVNDATVGPEVMAVLRGTKIGHA